MVKWLGHKQHYCGAINCEFSLATVVKGYLISTIGEYRKSDGGFAEIGHNRMLETMVFKTDGARECGCPKISDLDALDMLPANTPQEATANHMAMIEKYRGRDD